MLSNAYFLAKFRFDTAENEPAKNLQNFRKMHFSRRAVSLPPAGRSTPSRRPTRRRSRPPPASPGRAGSGDVRERRLAKFRQNVARFRLYRLRFLQENMHFAAFFKIYQILKLKFLKFDKIENFADFATFAT